MNFKTAAAKREENTPRWWPSVLESCRQSVRLPRARGCAVPGPRGRSRPPERGTELRGVPGCCGGGGGRPLPDLSSPGSGRAASGGFLPASRPFLPRSEASAPLPGGVLPCPGPEASRWVPAPRSSPCAQSCGCPGRPRIGRNERCSVSRCFAPLSPPPAPP